MRAFAALFFIVACGARTGVGVGSHDNRADGSIPNVDASTGITIHGKYTVRYFVDAGEIDLPKNLTASTIDARVGDSIFPGTGFADGTFTIADVPFGAVLLRVDDHYFDGIEDNVELYDTAFGRPDVDRDGDAVPLRLNLQNVAPLTLASTYTDLFELQSTNSGCGYFNPDYQLVPKPSVGAIALYNELTTGGVSPGCHIDASKGDLTTLYQVRAPVASDPPPRAFTIRKLDLPGFTGPKTQPIDIVGTLIDVPATSTATFDFRPSTFLAVIPGATVLLRIFGAPRDNTFGLQLGLSPNDGESLADGPVTIRYPNPFPQGLIRVTTTAMASVSLVPLDPKNPATGYLWSSRSLDLPTASGGPIELVLSPPKNVRIENATPLAPVANVGLRPVIRWERPDRSPPGPLRYRVAFQMQSNAIGHGMHAWTTATSFQIPDGILVPGGPYVVWVGADWSSTPLDFSHHPLDGSFNETSSATTGVFTP